MRETNEEAGFTPDDLQIYMDQQKILNYKVKGNDKTVVYWLAEMRNDQKNPTLSDEHTEFRWLNKDEAISLSGYKNFAEMVQYFHDKIGSLSLDDWSEWCIALVWFFEKSQIFHKERRSLWYVKDFFCVPYCVRNIITIAIDCNKP